MSADPLSHRVRLGAESLHVVREVTADAERPVMHSLGGARRDEQKLRAEHRFVSLRRPGQPQEGCV